MTFLGLAYAMGAPQGDAAAGANPIMSFLPLIVIFAIFYFLLIRPQQKRAKDHKNFLDALNRGDEVMTGGGLIGKITGLTDQVVTLEVADNTRVKVARANIAGPAPGRGNKEKESS
jgi:preprotein translocase subunit YajC